MAMIVLFAIIKLILCKEVAKQFWVIFISYIYFVIFFFSEFRNAAKDTFVFVSRSLL